MGLTPEQAAETLGHAFRFFKFGPPSTSPFQNPDTQIGPSPVAGLTPTSKDTTAEPSYGTDIQMSPPVGENYPITGAFNENREGHIHAGVDIGTPTGTPLIAAINGVVAEAGNNDPNGYGNMVKINSTDGLTAIYGHMSNIRVNVGDQVHEGMVIGASGGDAGAPGAGNSTGAHLHFEVRRAGTAIDPTPYLHGAVGGGKLEAAPDPAMAGRYTGNATSTPSMETISADRPAEALKSVANSLISGPTSDLVVPMTDEQRKNVSSKSGEGVTSANDKDPAGIDSFLAAIRTRESGSAQGNYRAKNESGQSNAAGAYQFIGTTWQGLGGSTPSAAEASPAEQDAIARRYAQQLFERFGSWRLAAIAWYSPVAAEQAARGIDPGAPEGQGSYLEYGNAVAKMMGN